MRRFLTSLVAAFGALGCSLPFPSVGATFPLDGAQVYESLQRERESGVH